MFKFIDYHLLNISSPFKHDKRVRHVRSSRPATNTIDAAKGLSHSQSCLGSKTLNTRVRMIEKILDNYDLFCINEKEEEHNDCTTTIDLALVHNLIAPEITLTKEYNLISSNHFQKVLREERETSYENNREWIGSDSEQEVQ